MPFLCPLAAHRRWVATLAPAEMRLLLPGAAARLQQSPWLPVRGARRERLHRTAPDMVAEENRRRGGNGCWQGRQALTSGMLQQGLYVATAVRTALLLQLLCHEKLDFPPQQALSRHICSVARAKRGATSTAGGQ